MGLVYLDTSAVVKLVRREAETDPLVEWLAARRWIVSDLHRTELRRAAMRVGPVTMRRADTFLAAADVIVFDGSMFDEGGRLEPTELRSLDALHLAAALTLGPDLDGIVTYDDRLGRAAAAAGVVVFAPA